MLLGMARWTPLVLILAIGCRKAPPPPATEDEALAGERKARDAELVSLRAKAYGTVRGAVPDGEITVKGQNVNTSEMAGLFAVAYILTGHKHLAFYEIVRVKDEDVPEEGRVALYLVRGYCYSSLGWRRLAKLEFERAAPPGEDRSSRAAEIRKILHYGMVYLYLKEKDHKAAADEVMSARDVFEGDPVGELCIALAHAELGEYGKAAEALDKAIASGRFDEATTRQMREISRELREAGNPLGLLWKLLLKRCRESEVFGGEKLRARYAAALDAILEKAKGLAEKVKP